MSRTAVRKHPTKSSAETATKQATTAPASPGNTAPAPNNAPPPSRVETHAQTPSVRTPMNPAKASSGKGESPVSSSQQPGQCLKQETSQSAREERLSGDKSYTRPACLPICTDYLAGHCHRRDCRFPHPPTDKLQPCRNFQEGRCLNMNCPRPHIKSTEAVEERVSQAPVASPLPSQQPPAIPLKATCSASASSMTEKALAPSHPTVFASAMKSGLSTVADSSRNSLSNDLQKKEVCCNFMKGRCWYGSRCHRLHPQDELTQQSGCSPSPSAQRQVTSTGHAGENIQSLPKADLTRRLADKESRKQSQTIHAGSSAVPVSQAPSTSKPPPVFPASQSSTVAGPDSADGSSVRSKPRRGGKGKDKQAERPVQSSAPMPSIRSKDSGEAVMSPRATSTISEVTQDPVSEPAHPPKEACWLFSRGRCRDTNCKRFHPPRYEWHKYYEKSDLPCLLYEADMCSAGNRCIFTHYRYSDAENVPTKQPMESIQPDKSQQSGANFNQRGTQPLGHSNGRGNRVSERMEGEFPGQRNPQPLSSSARSSRSARSGRNSGRGVSEKARMIVEHYETTETESDNSSVNSLSPQASPSIAPITLHDDTRSTDEDAEKPVCWEYLRGRCLHRNCRYKHVKDSDLTSQPRAVPLSADSSLSSIASASTNPRPRQGSLAQERDVLARFGELLETSRNRAAPPSTSNASIPTHSMRPFPLVPPGLGIESRLGIPEPRLPPEPPKSVTVNVVDGVQVTFGPGLEVQAVQTAFESRVVFLKGVPILVKATEITELCSTHGEVVGVRIPDPLPSSPTMTVRITMSSHEQASAVAKALNNKAIKKQRITASLASHKSTSLGKGNVQDGDVVLDFPAPFRHGYAGYATREAAEQAIALANEDEFEDCCVTAEIFDGVPRISTWTVRFAGLPPDAKADVLHKYGPNIGVMVGPPNYTKLIPSLRQLIRQLEMFGDLIELAVPSPPFPWQTVRAYAHFTSPQAAENACRELNGRKLRYLGYQPLQARHTKTVTYTLPVRVFDAIKGDLIALRPSLYGPEDNCRIDWSDRRRHQPDYRIVNVKVEAKEQTTLTRLKMAFEQLLRGDKLQEDGHPVWHPFFERPVGARYIEELQSRFPRVLINRDPRKRCIALYGRFWDRDTVRRELMDVVRRLRSQKVNTFPLNDSFISLCVSADLRKLQRDLGEENVRLDLETRTLKVRADEDTLQVVRLMLRNARRRHNGHRHPRGNDCPVCFSEVTLPVTLPCGHTWCKSCLSDYLMASVDTKVFPLLCLGDEARCKQPLPITVAREILSQERFAQVTNAAFLGHVHSRPNEFYYCPTPDCPQVYRSAPPNTVLQCPSCLVRICGNCHVEEHVGKTCTQRDDEERRQYERWAEHRDVKDCPNCKTHIERIAGCNHVLCAHCKTHICWVCLKTWPTAEAVYNHMSYTHGGIGL